MREVLRWLDRLDEDARGPELGGLLGRAPLPNGDPDTTPPVLTGLTLPTVVDVSRGDASATFAAAASDTGSGVLQVFIQLDRSFNSNGGPSSYIYLLDATDSFSDGQSSLSQEFDSSTGSGSYTITNVWVTDKAYNTVQYDTAQLTAMGFATSFSITRDVTPPTLTGLSLPQTVNVASGNAIADFSVGASDNGTGVQVAWIEFDRAITSSGAPVKFIYLFDSADSYSDGQSTLAQEFDRTTAPGVYTIASVHLYDKAENYTVYDTSQLTALGFATSFSVVDRTILTGTAGNDVLTGGPEDNEIHPNGGRDVVDGGGGDDLLVLSGARAGYSLETLGGHDYLLGSDGSGVEVSHIATVRFADGDVAWSALAANATPLDVQEYIDSNPDLIRAYGTDTAAAAAHYEAYGFFEGRAVASFDPVEYLASNPDLIAAFGLNTTAAEAHYAQFGYGEGRAVASFDPLRYIASYGDLIAAFGTNTAAATAHYVQFGYGEGRTASFDPIAYAAASPDLAAAFGTDAHAAELHYIEFGHAEGRPTSGFDDVAYLLSNPDLAAAGFTPGQALTHWLTFGADEGRAGDALYGREQAGHDLPSGGAVAGLIDRPGDHDWFLLSLAAGHGAQLTLTGGGPLELDIHDSHGVLLSSATAGAGGTASLSVSADHDEQLYVTVESRSSGYAGSYSLADHIL